MTSVGDTQFFWFPRKSREIARTQDTRGDTFAFERSLTMRVLAPARGARTTLRAASMTVFVEAAIAGAWIVPHVRVVDLAVSCVSRCRHRAAIAVARRPVCVVVDEVARLVGHAK